MIQLEFELWVEERFSEYDIIAKTPKGSRFHELMYHGYANHADIRTYQSPTSAHTLVRYKV